MLLLLVAYDAYLLLTLLQDNETNFNDMGKLMLLGVVGAVALAVGFTFVRLRLRDKKPQSSGFTTIGSYEERK